MVCIEKHNAFVWIVAVCESAVKHRLKRDLNRNTFEPDTYASSTGELLALSGSPLTLLDSVHLNKPSDGQASVRNRIRYAGSRESLLLLLYLLSATVNVFTLRRRVCVKYERNDDHGGTFVSVYTCLSGEEEEKERKSGSWFQRERGEDRKACFTRRTTPPTELRTIPVEGPGSLSVTPRKLAWKPLPSGFDIVPKFV